MKFSLKSELRCRLRVFAYLLSITVLLGLNGCVSGPTVAGSETSADGTPDWVRTGSAALRTSNDRLFHGVGTAGESSSFSLQTTTADNRARNELSRILASYLEISSRDYIASGKAGAGQFTPQTVSQFIENITDMNMRGVRIADHWRDKKSNLVYSVAEINMQHVKETLNKVGGMHEGFKNYLLLHADSIFDQIARRGD